MPIFVVHKHHARNLHYDLRLENEGVLVSWAVPKEPPRTSGDRRLAIRVDDHDLEYARFEGKIPKGQYGAGDIEIWDNGTYVPIKFDNKEVIADFKGRKLKGTYCIIRLKPKISTGKNWLFFKMKANTA